MINLSSIKLFFVFYVIAQSIIILPMHRERFATILPSQSEREAHQAVVYTELRASRAVEELSDDQATTILERVPSINHRINAFNCSSSEEYLCRVLLGESGTGKKTIARAMAKKLGGKCVEVEAYWGKYHLAKVLRTLNILTELPAVLFLKNIRIGKTQMTNSILCSIYDTCEQAKIALIISVTPEEACKFSESLRQRLIWGIERVPMPGPVLRRSHILKKLKEKNLPHEPLSISEEILSVLVLESEGKSFNEVGNAIFDALLNARVHQYNGQIEHHHMANTLWDWAPWWKKALISARSILDGYSA